MKIKNYLILLSFFLGLTAFSNNDKYRIIINSDPATTITIGWNQISGSNPIVYYGTSDLGTDWQSYPNQKGVDRQLTFKGMDNRFARLSGLTPNTSYYFVIHDSQGTSSRFWFKTAPEDLSRLSFIAGGDSRNNRTPRQNANLLVSKLKPHAVFFGGDMTDDDTSSEWQDWFEDWQFTTAGDGRMFPIVAARGNHEYDAQTVYNLFDTPNTNSYYAVTFGDNMIRTYTLNSEISVLGNQLSWLQNDLNSAAGTSAKWKMAQYHKPMRPHTSGKSEGNDIYNAWAQLFYDQGVNLVVDCDSHLAKTTYPIKPSNGSNSEEGFEIDNQFGTVYTGEGSWGAPLRSANDNKAWTRSSGSFNQFKLVFIDENKMELRTIQVDNAGSVGENPNNNPFQLPNNLDVFSPSTGAVVTILSNSNNCDPAGTACDDRNSNTINDVEDGFCNCSGIPQGGTLDILVADDAEEGENGTVYLDSSDIELVFDSFNSQNNQTIGLRFGSIPLPSNATINNAYIQFTVDESDSGSTSLVIRGEDAGNSNFFSTSNNNVSNRTLTSSQVNWNNIPSWSTGDSGTNQRTPDLSSIVSEILAHPSWASNNAMSFIITGSGTRTAESIEGGGSNAARLIINYSTTPINTCNAPTNLTSIGITTNSVDLNWTSASSATNGYEWVVMADGDSPNTATALSTGTTSDLSVTISALQDNTNYAAYLRSDCGGGDVSNWSSVLSFTTLEDVCNVPPNFTVNNISGTSADLSWSAIGDAGSSYQWIVMADGISPNAGSAQFTGTTSGTSVQLAGLSNLSTYNAYVRSDCGNGDLSEWSSVAEFTINTCPPAGTNCNDGNSNTINDAEDGLCNCAGVIPGGSINILVSDDVEQGESGAMYFDSSDIELVFDSFDSQNNQTVGLRFTNVQLPPDAIITSAYIQFTADETDTGGTNLNINGEYAGNASLFSNSNNNVSNRTKTSSGVEVSWNNVPSWNNVGESGPAQRTPNLSGIVQEIVTHPGWSSSNAMVFIITGTGSRVAESLDGTTSSAARLIVEYSIVPTITCNAPTALNSSNLTTDGVTLDWNTQADAEGGYEYVVMANGIPPNMATAQTSGTTSNTSAQITGLSDYTTYNAYVRGICSNDDVSDWSLVEEFTTLEICNTPSNLASTNVSTNSVNLSWNSTNNSNNSYQWVVMANGQAPDETTSEVNGITSKLNISISGLSDSTTYTAFVRSICSSGISSDWSPGEDFTTIEACNIPLNLSSNNQIDTSIELSWDAADNATNGYQWLVMQDGETPNPLTALFSGTTSSTLIQVTGLTNLSTYDAYVRSDCGNENLSGWSSVEEFTINNCPPAGTACDDGDDCTSGDVQDGDCNCQGLFQDSDNDDICDADDTCPEFDDALIGTPCDDGDACTTGETYDASCNCSGGSFADSDADGVCDAEDICPDSDDNIDADNNGIPDGCDNACTDTLIDFNNFESSWGIWNDGGSDSRRSSRDAAYAYSGSRSVRLRDNTSSSVMTTDNLNLVSYEELTVSFTYYPRSMDNSSEDFWLQISTNGGSSYTIVEEWNRNDEFVNDVREFDVVTIPGPFTSSTRLRFRCDASGNSDWVYIDDVEISGCYTNNNNLVLKPDDNQSNDTPKSSSANTIKDSPVTITEIKAYPNPVSSVLNIDVITGKLNSSSIRVLDILGRERQIVTQQIKEGANNLKVNLTDLSPGYYFVEIVLDNKRTVKKIVKR